MAILVAHRSSLGLVLRVNNLIVRTCKSEDKLHLLALSLPHFFFREGTQSAVSRVTPPREGKGEATPFASFFALLPVGETCGSRDSCRLPPLGEGGGDAPLCFRYKGTAGCCFRSTAEGVLSGKVLPCGYKKVGRHPCGCLPACSLVV